MESNVKPQPEETSAFPSIRAIGMDAPWRWLREGWSDFKRAKGASLFYGMLLSLMGVILTQFAGEGALALAFVTGFLIVGPFLLMGLYDVGRRARRGEKILLAPSITAWRVNAPAIGFYALILALLLAVWLRISVVVVALFFPEGVPGGTALVQALLESPDGIVFVLAYIAAGFGFALFVFATSVVSLPMMLEREKTDTLTAMITSFNALRLNFWPMVLWAVIIVVLTAVGFATLYVGLLIALPLIGYATWHAYKETVA